MATAKDLRTLGDREVVALAKAGKEAAYRELLSRYERPVFSLIYRMVRDRALAEDLAQEGFLRAFQRLGSYDPDRKFSSWFFQVLRNLTIDYLRVNRIQT
ncbi:MAG TPA: sigma-70 family RNA polymerase sigma factor, partial [Candidatus Sulfotelmatobacter sp.]|nr:sigma-70 family RNA polymerase sigma factor [Candidatus Sulfotelmatobacter sp.]